MERPGSVSSPTIMSTHDDSEAGDGKATSRTSKFKDTVTSSARDIEARLSRLPVPPEQEEERQEMLSWIRSVVGDDSYLRELDEDPHSHSSLELVLSPEASSSAEQGDHSSSPEGSDTETDSPDTGSSKRPSIGFMPTPKLTPLRDSARASSPTAEELDALRAHVAQLHAHLAYIHVQNQQLREENDRTWNLARWTYAHLRGLDGQGGLGLHPVLELVLILWISMLVVKWMMAWFA